jgi:hypothetical protein
MDDPFNCAVLSNVAFSRRPGIADRRRILETHLHTREVVRPEPLPLPQLVPPDAAFIAADELGIYLQPETPLWIDSWKKDRSPTHPDVFGQDPAVVEFIRAEVKRILETYGNHPSFCMFSLGNELPESSDYAEMQRIVNDARQRDPRRLYAICTARLVTPADDYSVSHASPGGATRGLGKPNTDWDFSNAVQSLSIPLIQHESGQRPVFPDYSKLDQYTGPLKPHNLEVYRDALAARGMLDQNRDFTLASEKWTAIQYRQEIEGVLRTPDYAGFQLLQLNDFTGQAKRSWACSIPSGTRKGTCPPNTSASSAPRRSPCFVSRNTPGHRPKPSRPRRWFPTSAPATSRTSNSAGNSTVPHQAGLYEKRGELDTRALPSGGSPPGESSRSRWGLPPRRPACTI